MDSQTLTPLIDSFCAAHRMSGFTFGWLAVRNGRLVERLRAGGDVTTRTAERIRAFMRDYEPPKRRGRRRKAEQSTQERKDDECFGTGAERSDGAGIPLQMPANSASGERV